MRWKKNSFDLLLISFVYCTYNYLRKLNWKQWSFTNLSIFRSSFSIPASAILKFIFIMCVFVFWWPLLRLSMWGHQRLLCDSRGKWRGEREQRTEEKWGGDESNSHASRYFLCMSTTLKEENFCGILISRMTKMKFLRQFLPLRYYILRLYTPLHQQVFDSYAKIFAVSCINSILDQMATTLNRWCLSNLMN